MQKKKMNSLFMAGALLAGSMIMGAQAQAGSHGGGMASAKALSDTCAGCHGTDGVAVGPAMPTIAGQPAAHIAEVMKEYKAGERPSTIMGRISKGYSDAEIDAIAKYLAKETWGNNVANPRLAMKTGTPFTKVDDALAAKGEKYAKKLKCGKCHEDAGRSTEDDMPRMAGQWVDYLLIKMDDYKNPDMKVPQPKKMKKRMKKATLEQLQAISHYYASQK
uniref:Cytochrome subunit of sulfide dehydrogenase FccA n=1 Tax=Magnetococcus massalia (strain MO-1) TaxID=451514 RepID=A0A1S7LMK8_MAGMO|nr:Cytochrome subunit of sulfide dehydrogenase FccA [Candidatus Magnetococcus massalia]